MMIPVVLWHRTPIRFNLGEDRLSGDPHQPSGRRCPARTTAGYTLLELMIVLALISLLAALSMPALMRPWSRSHVQQAAQDLSRALLKARLDAIQHGRAYQFRWRKNTGEYEIASWQGAAPPNLPTLDDRSGPARLSVPGITSTDNLRQAGSDRSANRELAADRPESSQAPRAQTLRLIRGRLTNGVVFVPDERPVVDSQHRQPPQSLNQDRSVPDSQWRGPPRESLEQPATQRPWQEPIWFFPDGRASTAELLLQDVDGYTIRLSLRGLTGTVRVGEVRKVERRKIVNDVVPQGTAESQPVPISERPQ